MVEAAAAGELAPRDASRHLDGPVVRVHLRPFLAALQALENRIIARVGSFRDGTGTASNWWLLDGSYYNIV